MTIKQQGGIFGRNPTFNTLNVQNGLTVGGTVTHSGTQNITGQLNVDNLRLDGNTISVLDSNGNLVLAPNGTGDVYTIGDAVVTKGNFQDVSLTIANGPATVGNKREILFTDQSGTTAYIRAFGSAQGSGLNNIMRFGSGASSFDLNPSGNIVLSSGSGIDFSATAGTGTSELFSDYEEGTFTLTDPGVKDAVSGTWTFVSGVYTKVGRQVTVNATFSGTGLGFSANTGYYRWDGLPFSASQAYSGTWQGPEAFKAAAGFVFTSSNRLWLHAAISTQTSDSGIIVTATYTV